MKKITFTIPLLITLEIVNMDGKVMFSKTCQNIHKIPIVLGLVFHKLHTVKARLAMRWKQV